MANRKSAIPFSSTPEQDQKLEEVLQELRGTQGAGHAGASEGTGDLWVSSH